MNQNHDPVSEAAKRDLERLHNEGETLGGTSMDQATRQAQDQFASAPDAEDGIEKLGKKIGRGLAFAVLPVALWYFGKTSGWW